MDRNHKGLVTNFEMRILDAADFFLVSEFGTIYFWWGTADIL